MVWLLPFGFDRNRPQVTEGYTVAVTSVILANGIGNDGLLFSESAEADLSVARCGGGVDPNIPQDTRSFVK